MPGKKRHRRRYRIMLTDGKTATVSGNVFRAHLAAHRIEVFKHDDRKAETKANWVSYEDERTGELIFTDRKPRRGVPLPTNSNHLLNRVIFQPPYNEWLHAQEYDIYRRQDV